MVDMKGIGWIFGSINLGIHSFSLDLFGVINVRILFAAGADLIITNTYQASVQGFVDHLGVTAEQAYALIERAAELAKRARSLYLEEYQEYLQSGQYYGLSIMYDVAYFRIESCLSFDCFGL